MTLLIKILSEYDYQIGKILKLKDVKLVIATGLHQQAHEYLTFYWRLKEHIRFLEMIGIKSLQKFCKNVERFSSEI